MPLLGADSRFLTPRAPERSEILPRMNLKEGGRMPLLGSDRTDTEGAELIRRWILQLNRP